MLSAVLCGICTLSRVIPRHHHTMHHRADPPAVFNAHSDVHALRARLDTQPDALVIACYCAAWCKMCTAYRHDFDALARRLPQHVFVWIDIEECPQLLGDEDVENFPTLWLQCGQKTLFYGVQQPFIQHLEGLIARRDRLVPVSEQAPLVARLEPV